MVAATFPTLAPGTGWAMDELAPARRLRAGGRRPHRHRRRRRKPASGRAAYLSCAPTPVVVDIGPALRGGGDAGLATVYDLVASSLDPTDDIHATAVYRRHLAATLTVRAVDRALARARAGTWPWNFAAVGDALASPTAASSDVVAGE